MHRKEQSENCDSTKKSTEKEPSDRHLSLQNQFYGYKEKKIKKEIEEEDQIQIYFHSFTKISIKKGPEQNCRFLSFSQQKNAYSASFFTSSFPL